MYQVSEQHTINNPEGVSEKTALALLDFQKRCINCGSTYALQIHHRVFRSEGEIVLHNFLSNAMLIYKLNYGVDLALWHLHDIQNLCVLCLECHEGKNGVHNGNEKLRQKLRNSFTEPITGFNISFFKEKTLW